MVKISLTNGKYIYLDENDFDIRELSAKSLFMLETENRKTVVCFAAVVSVEVFTPHLQINDVQLKVITDRDIR